MGKAADFRRPASAGTVLVVLIVLIVLGVLGCLQGCLQGVPIGTPDAERLLGASSANTLGSCSQCHAYPPADRNHEYHLVKAPNTSAFNKSVTCYDCHGGSILADTLVALDTVFRGFFGEELRSSEFPDEPRIRELEVLRVDSLARAVPAAYPDQGEETFEATLRMFKTAAAHMNGKVDVMMHPDAGLVPRWDAEKLTCSAVACHTSPKEYPIDVGFAGKPPGRSP